MGRCRAGRRRRAGGGGGACSGGCCDCCPRTDACQPVDPCTPAGRFSEWLWPGAAAASHGSDGAAAGCDDNESCDSEQQDSRIACALMEFKRCVLGTVPARVVLCLAGARAILWLFDIDLFIVQV